MIFRGFIAVAVALRVEKNLGPSLVAKLTKQTKEALTSSHRKSRNVRKKSFGNFFRLLPSKYMYCKNEKRF